MADIQIPYKFEPRDFQLELFRAMDGIEGVPSSRKKRAILRWHRRAGKDKACWCYMIKEAMQRVGNYFYVFPTAKDARSALWENIDKSGFRLLDHIPKEIVYRKSNLEMAITLIHPSEVEEDGSPKAGSTINVSGFDTNPDAARGTAIAGAVFSEYGFANPEAYKVMSSSIIEAGGWVIFNSTPNGRNHYYDMWNGTEGDERWFRSYRQTLWPDKDGYTGIMSIADIRAEQDALNIPDEEIEREFGCSFDSGMTGSFYSSYIEVARKDGRILEGLYNPDLPVDTFWDLGRKDSTSIWFRQKQGNYLNFIDYYEITNKGFSHFANVLDSKGYRYRTHYLPWDGNIESQQTDKTNAESLAECFRNLNISDDIEVIERSSVQQGITQVYGRFNRYRFDADRCREGIDKLEKYRKRFNRQTKSFSGEPVHDENSHCADALRTEAMAYDRYDNASRNQTVIKLDTKFNLWDL